MRQWASARCSSSRLRHVMNISTLPYVVKGFPDWKTSSFVLESLEAASAGPYVASVLRHPHFTCFVLAKVPSVHTPIRAPRARRIHF
jgi:hypothetical protein